MERAEGLRVGFPPQMPFEWLQACPENKTWEQVMSENLAEQLWASKLKRKYHKNAFQNLT